MTKFFSMFPKIKYDINDTNQYEVVTNLFFRLKFIEEAKKNSNLYFEYLVKDGETPEIIAEKMYGDSESHWVILMMNDIVDPQFDWPLDYRSFNNHIISKYGSLANSQITVHHSEIVIRRIDNAGTETDQIIQIDTSTPNANISSTIPYNSYDYGSLPVSEPVGELFTLPDGTTVREKIWKRQINIYDWENALNERKRTIKLLMRNYYSQIQREFQNFTQQENPVLRIGTRTARL